MNKESKSFSPKGFILHLTIWTALFILPITFVGNEEQMSMKKYLITSVWPISWAFAFYVNYFWLAPTYYINNEIRKTRCINIAIIIMFAIALHFWMLHNKEILHTNIVMTLHKQIVLFVKDLYALTLSTTLGCAIIMSKHWVYSENQRKETENIKREAELISLKYQIQPHFLLNTLNNIYALTSINQQKAQETIKQFSELLQHQLYNNQKELIDIRKEAEFIHNYICLMKIRLSNHVKVIEETDIAPNDEIYVAPMILITLVENAFKHGISTDEDCLVHISLKASKEKIEFEVENSNHPKDILDKSGHGIGLDMLKKKLDIMYPQKYTWEKRLTSNNIYTTKITIYDTKLRNN